MPFLKPDKKVWEICGKEYPVREDVPIKDLQWFRKTLKEVDQMQDKGELTPGKAVDIDDEWFEKTCQIGLGISKDELFETGITTAQFNELMGELYHFLTVFTTIEGAKQSGYYDQKTKEQDKKD